MVQLTKEMIEDKLRQIAIHEKRFGECSHTRAMKKYCENEIVVKKNSNDV